MSSDITDNFMDIFIPDELHSDSQAWDDLEPMWNAANEYFQALREIREEYEATRFPTPEQLAQSDDPFYCFHLGKPRNDSFQIMKRSHDVLEDDEAEANLPGLSSIAHKKRYFRHQHVKHDGLPLKYRLAMAAAEAVVEASIEAAESSSIDMQSLNSINELDSSSSDVAEADDSSSYCSDLSGSSSESSDDSDDAAERAIGGRMTGSFTPGRARDVDTEHVSMSKPSFVLSDLQNSPLHSLIPDFLAKMQAANAELEQERASGTLGQRNLELGDNEDPEGQYIEMNLGLGVLEEKADSSSSEDDSSSDDSNPMQKLTDIHGAKEQQEGGKVMIEEV